MKASEILKWFGFGQGTASKSAIRGLWNAWPEETECIYVEPGSRFESLGLRAGQNYRTESAYAAIGCEVE
jgi:hypothetical protein